MDKNKITDLMLSKYKDVKAYDALSTFIPNSQLNMYGNSFVDSVATNYSANYARHMLEDLNNTLIVQETSDTERQLYNLLGKKQINPLSTEISRFAIRHQGSAVEKSYRNNVIPTASFDTSKVTFPTFLFEGGIEYQERQIQQINVCGINALFEFAKTQKEVLDMVVDDLVLVGNGRDLKGFFNHDEVLTITNDSNIMDLIKQGQFSAVKDIFTGLKKAVRRNASRLLMPDTFIISEDLDMELREATSESIQLNATNITLKDFLEKTTNMKFIVSKRLCEQDRDNAGIKITDADRTRIICARLGGKTKENELIAYYDYVPFTLFPPIMKEGRMFSQTMHLGSSGFCLVDKDVMTYLDIKIA